MEHYREYLEAQGQAELAAVAVASQQWDADFDLEGVPDIPQADLPPQPSQVCHRSYSAAVQATVNVVLSHPFTNR